MTTDIIDKIADDLLGTCKSLDDVLDYYGLTFDRLTNEQLIDLDNQTVQCNLCGWWHAPDEINDEGNCLDCEEQN